MKKRAMRMLYIGCLLGRGVAVAGGYYLQEDKAPEILALSCEHKGMFSTGYGWTLSVDSKGRAVLTVLRSKEKIVRHVVLREHLRVIEGEVSAQQFFGLPSEIGRVVSDGSVRRLTIKTQHREKTVTIRYISSADETAARALRVWDAVRSSFEEKAAFDERPYDRALLKRRN